MNVYIETYGCQMNVSDSGIVGKILTDNGFTLINRIEEANVILINTCSIRDNAEKKVKNRITELNALKRKNKIVIGILGCMAERLKEDLIENYGVDIVCGVDSYRKITDLIMDVNNPNYKKVVNDYFSSSQIHSIETYDDITPIQMDSNGVTAFVSIMRGCENFCSYCVVPYTRGKERSRNRNNIIKECEYLFENGYREITLLGQNVNSYNYNDTDFADLISKVAAINPLLRVRFATSHPKDISDKLILTIASYKNICKAIHLPVQSGSNAVLKRMNRKYTREQYMEKINKIKTSIPNCGLSTDIIVGFCGETQTDFEDTLCIMREVKYDYAFMFAYSERSDTFASKKYIDDISPLEKNERLTKVINLQRELSLTSNKNDIGKEFEVLIEGVSKRSPDKLFGRNTQNKVIIFDNKGLNKGEYVKIKVTDCTSATLIGEVTV
ncbi:MAG: tRNA (N6-isopentenyl adenosine(37)-C2)-methylthiotransferase MiaB [Bacteroidales bacterium]|jgi:tRNA-2-methylthio-N6-dimethylallyladenosine synthase|nr:tRNA (N6-isopentenyl adenosine(37)-C2)-methylthiotransferase MiaB [Bacteroidales bacterium]